MKLITVALIMCFLPIPGHAQNRVVDASLSTSQVIASYKVVDIMPSFWQFWEQSQNLDQEAKIRLFRQLVFEPNKEVFEAFTGKSDDARLARYLEKVQKYIPAMRRLYDQVITDLPRSGRSFAKKFPDGKGNGTIYFLPNLLSGWNAGAGSPGGRPMLLFGVDSIVQINREGFNIAVLFHHELFHLYHNELHPEWQDKKRGEIPLYRSFWGEGLASYVSKVLNPKASDEDVVLATPLIQQTEALMPKLVRELRENLDSTSMDAVMNFLSGSPKRPDIPARCGYYIGMLVARELNRKHSLRELARLRDPQLRKEIENALIKLESRYAKPSRP
jgi:hypothetical protein